MIAFLTENYLKSDNCLDEIEHAKNKGIKILMIYLEDIKIPGWFEMRHNRTQAVLKSHYNSEESFYKRIYSAKMLDTSKQLNNIKKDMASLIKSAENGNAEAQYRLGKYYIKKEDEKEAIKWYTMAACNENAYAQYMLGIIYKLKRNDKESIKWLIKSAENGNAEAQNELGGWVIPIKAAENRYYS